MTGALLEAIDLRKHYTVSGKPLVWPKPVARAVDGVDFAVPQGGTLGLIGESGCGKTTTARVLLRLEPLTSGRILFDGVEVQSAKGKALSAYRRQVQAVFQDPYSSLNPRRAVADAIAEPLVAAGALPRTEIAARVATLLDVVGLPREAGARLPHEFSGGQRQRVAIARGLALQPRLLILDEPVSALDISIRAQILNLLSDLQDEFGLTYLLISHDLEVVAHMATRVAVMYLGKIVERGSAEQVMRAPQHPYTRALLSSVLPGHPDHRRDRIKLRGPLPSPLDPPSGCVFRTRCPLAEPICAETPPPMVNGAGGGEAACHFVAPATEPVG